MVQKPWPMSYVICCVFLIFSSLCSYFCSYFFPIFPIFPFNSFLFFSTFIILMISKMCWLLNDMVHVYIGFFITGPMNYHILLLCQSIPVFERLKLAYVPPISPLKDLLATFPELHLFGLEGSLVCKKKCQDSQGIMGWWWDDHMMIMVIIGWSWDHHGVFNGSWDDHGIVFLPKSCVVLQTILKPGSEFSTEAIRGSHGWFPGGWAMICQTHPC